MEILTTPVNELIKPSLESGLVFVSTIVLFILVKIKQKAKLQNFLKSSLGL